jgi:protein TonB
MTPSAVSPAGQVVPRPSDTGGTGRATPDLFESLGRPPRRDSRRWRMVVVSVVGHGVLGALVILVPLFYGDPFPETAQAFQTVIFNPPPPPPPPLARGPAVERRPVSPTLPEPRPNAFTAPEDAVKPPEDRVPDLDANEGGMADGQENGVVGGVPGGVAGGVIGGVVGGTGTGEAPVGDPDRPPQPIRTRRPHYPQDAFVKRIEGTVELEILIDALGRVVRTRVLRSIPLLDAAAIETVRDWIFAPATKNGRPVASLALAPVTFRIH